MASPEYLVNGFKRFRDKHFVENNVLYSNLVERGQKPKIMVVGCCDSRVDPAIVLDCAPGDLFVIRNVANIVPPSENLGGHHGTSAALEFGVCNLCVKDIIVLGHAHCGGIHTLVENGGIKTPDSFIEEWMHLLEDARLSVERDMPEETIEVRTRICEQRALLISLRNLMSFPWLRERVESGSLTLSAWYFDIENGQLLQYDEDSRIFVAL